MSAAQASDIPPPAATPLTTAMTGCGMRRARPAAALPFLLQVRTGAEAPAGSGEDDDPVLGVVAQVGQLPPQRAHQRRRQRVQPARPVQRERQHAPRALYR
jgi:hypothetical protein